MLTLVYTDKEGRRWRLRDVRQGDTPGFIYAVREADGKAVSLASTGDHGLTAEQPQEENPS